MADNEKINNILQTIKKDGLTLIDLFNYQISKDRSLLGIPDDIKSKFDSLYDKLSENHQNTKAKGDALEKLVQCLMFSKFGLFNFNNNIRTSSNEIDLFVTLTDKGKLIIPKMYSFLGENFLCECKNYNRKLDVTYVGKFFSLLRESRNKIGIIFTIKGVTGRSNWSDSKALIRKIALKEDIYILDFSLNDFKLIKENNINFLDLVEKKYLALKNDINYEELISAHEAEKFLIESM